MRTAKKNVGFVVVSVLLAGLGSPAWAVPVPIQNASFEAVVLGDGGFSFTIPDWNFGGTDTGTFNPNATAYPGGQASDGENIAFVGQGDPVDTIASQLPGELLTAGTTYTLEVDVGQRLDWVIGPYDIQLAAGGVVLASDNSASPAPGTFETVTVMYTAASGDPQLGQPLEIRLVANMGAGNQINFDNVRLDAAIPVPTVLPTGLILMAALLAAIGFFFAQRTRRQNLGI